MNQLDQSNHVGGVSIGFGQASGLKYSAQGFVPTVSHITALAFKLNDLGTKDMRVWIDEADENSFPLGTLETGLGFIDIPRAGLTTALTTYQLPTPITVIPGKQYALCMAPWDISRGCYADDYRNLDCSIANSYPAGKMAHYQNGVWTNNDQGKGDMVFEIYGSIASPSLALSPASPNAKADDILNINILLDTQGQPIAGVDVDALHYDPKLLQLVDPVTLLPTDTIQPGSLMSNTVFNKVDTVTGAIKFLQLTTLDGPNFTGNGVLATMTFKILPVTTAITFDFTPGSTVDCNLAGLDGTDILGTVTNGLITIS